MTIKNDNGKKKKKINKNTMNDITIIVQSWALFFSTKKQ